MHLTFFPISSEYVCPVCKKFNPSRQSRQLHPNGPVIPPASPLPGSRPSSAVLPDQDDNKGGQLREEEERKDDQEETVSVSDKESERERETGREAETEEEENEQSQGESTSIGARVRRRHKASTARGGRKSRTQ